MTSGLAFAPFPDFRYVGLEPVTMPRPFALATAVGLGAGVTLAMSGLDMREALVAGAAASFVSAFALRGGAREVVVTGGTRMAIVPWGVLVHADDSPRILRWAAVRHVEVAASRLSSRVVIETQHERFIGAARGFLALDRLVAHLDAYATEQATPIALDLVGEQRGVGGATPACEMLLSAAIDYLETSGAFDELGLCPAGYRRIGAHAPSVRAVGLLRAVLQDRTPKTADPRAFAAVLAAELHAEELVPDLVALAQCPQPVVAAVARQAAKKLGASRQRAGTLEEVAPFLFDSDRLRLESYR